MRIDRENMGRLGITAQNVDDILNDAFGQRQISTIYTQSNQYRVILEAAAQYQRDPTALEKLYVAPLGGGPQTPLATFVTLEQTSRAAVGRPSGTVSGVRRSASISREGYVAWRRGADDRAKRKQRSTCRPSILGVFSADAAEFNKSLASEPWLILAAVIVDLRRAGRSLRELRASVHRADDSALGGRRRLARA